MSFRSDDSKATKRKEKREKKPIEIWREKQRPYKRFRGGNKRFLGFRSTLLSSTRTLSLSLSSSCLFRYLCCSNNKGPPGSVFLLLRIVLYRLGGSVDLFSLSFAFHSDFYRAKAIRSLRRFSLFCLPNPTLGLQFCRGNYANVLRVMYECQFGPLYSVKWQLFYFFAFSDFDLILFPTEERIDGMILWSSSSTLGLLFRIKSTQRDTSYFRRK